MAKILIVDDDMLISTLMHTLVSMDGHEGTVVNDSAQAVEVAKSIGPDLITLDLMMPKLSGFDLCALLRAEPQFAHTPIIIVSAKEDPRTKETAFAAGATEYITKPFNIDEFLSTIKRLIS